MNDKSRFLDHLRYEVGMVPDRAHTLKDFYLGILKAIGGNISKDFSTGLFLVRNNKFHLIGCIGKPLFTEKENFGEGKLSICALKGDVGILEYRMSKILCCPFYDRHHLLGILVISTRKNYETTEEDIIFLKELSSFIGSKQKLYGKQSN